ncbi:cytochrome C oxidase subunit II [Candidatus Woesearchaeota archaeon CG10_big_fil_rev_8_21_14_0_10_32_24]|nr:MAG: cytochrome C oxidase subunit II [Candidatus Woesearchaeota archaeon CG10_big_fil_rev_8_21_14_0_10_32_24]
MKKLKIYLLIVLITLSLILMGCASKEIKVADSQSKSNEIDIPQEQPTTSTESQEESVVNINMVAKKWEFIPSEIKVKKGDKIKLTIYSEDVAHGIVLPEFDVNLQFQPGETREVEFIADKVGIFTFSCNVFCGEGHGGMVGRLIVE